MYDSRVILDRVLAMLREIPAVMDSLESDANIYAYEDSYPNKMDLAEAIRAMGRPELMGACSGVGAGRRDGAEVWEHRFSLYISPRPSDEDGGSPWDIWLAIANGKREPEAGPALNTEWWNEDVLAGAFLLTPPSVARRRLILSASEGKDYLEVTFAVQESGGNP